MDGILTKCDRKKYLCELLASLCDLTFTIPVSRAQYVDTPNCVGLSHSSFSLRLLSPIKQPRS
jgi:hypothetical protein